MILGWTAAEIRAAEEPLLARGVPLMQQAAFALATRVAAELVERRGGVRGSTVVALVGAGNNGGDALHAGAVLARRGARVVALCTVDAPHADGLAALRRAGGRALRVLEPEVARGSGRHAASPDDPASAVGPTAAGGPTASGGTVTPGAATTTAAAGASVTPAAAGPSVTPAAAGPSVTPAAAGPSVTPAAAGPSVTPAAAGPSVTPAAAGASATPAPDVTAAPVVAPAPFDPDAGLPAVWLGDAVAEAFAADVLLDGVLGIGGRGAPRGVAGLLTGLLHDLLADDDTLAGAPLVVAVDVPSGVGVDDGTLPDGPVLPADVTVTFGGAKPGLLLPPAARRAGRVHVVDLGLPLPERPAVARLTDGDAADLWPVPGPEDHKYSRGVLGVVAGTPAYPGAAVLAVSAAVRAGVGMVRYVGPSSVARAVLAARPEVVVGEGRVQAWLIGPGVDPAHGKQTSRVTGVLRAALREGIPVVVDAGALALAPPELAPWCVLTPHAGELAALLTRWGDAVDRADVEAEPWRWARRAHDRTGATVLLKGSTTVVVGVGGAVYAQAEAPPWLATAGSGDVLAGLLGALLAGRAADVLEDPPLAAALAAAAALVHGRAAQVARPGGPVAALDVADALPATVAGLLRA